MRLDPLFLFGVTIIVLCFVAYGLLAYAVGKIAQSVISVTDFLLQRRAGPTSGP